MTKVLFWLGALFAIFQVAYPVFVQKMEEYRKQFPKEPDPEDEEPEYTEPVQVVSSTPSAVPSSARSVSAMEPNEAF